MLDRTESLHERREAMEEIDDVHVETSKNRDEPDPEDENLLMKARSTRLR